ncbi:MAG TPA: hypothetical protein VFV10_14240 [Gammaproteobacteria bacterium]|nr:hypothetical protein [Gammaproteobacteria bacterium]
MSVADVVRELARLGPEVLQAIVDWLDGNDDRPEALDRLPDTLRSEIELARLEGRAKK